MIQDCIRAGIFADFVQKHGSEVVNMLFTQFNLEDAIKFGMRKLSRMEKREAGFKGSTLI